ncbi:NEP1-interacting protein-like 2 [Vigna unguiculata]|nr:NEP1-interacting protein-like 2 [Vigna unguiculata]
MSKVILEFSFDPESLDSESQEFPLNLDIMVDVLQDGESEVEEEEEEEEVMELNAIMIPASEEAIDSLIKFTTLPSLRMETEKCSICMENFRLRENEETVKLSSMSYDHVFHHLCIVKWLKTSHTCPLCRYPVCIHKI